MLNSTDLTTSIVFIDASVENYEQLEVNVLPHVQVHILKPHQDGIQQITEVLAGYEGYAQSLDLHIVAHGSPGWVSLGNTQLSLSHLEQYGPQIQSWFSHRASTSHLYLYACNAAAGDAGEELLSKLHQLTGAAIYGSTSKVGNADLGGSWELNAIAYSAPNNDGQALAIGNDLVPFSEEILATYAGVLVDTDGDGIDDDVDLDDDNDGIPDELEGPAPTDSGQDGAYADAVVDFGVTGTVLNSISVEGITYTELTTPSSYQSGFTTISAANASGIYVINNGDQETDFGSSANWNADAIAPFASRDLNYYQGIDTGVSGSDFFELGYDIPVIATSGMFVAFTERNSNNAVQLQAFDANGNPLAAAISVPTGDYIKTGVNVEYRDSRNNLRTQELGIAVYPLDDLAPVGSAISSIRVIPEQNGSDAADGKVFIFGNNTLQTSIDTDGDGIPNRVDLDSDNDGISDLVESGQNAALIDQNNDGIRDDIANGISTTPNPSDLDGDGLADAVDGANTITIAPDFDADGIPNYLDLDADNDGIPDVIEAQPTAGYTSNGTANSDLDQDGVLDAFDSAGSIFGGQFVPPENTDGIDQPDYLDLDSDNDGLNDIAESGLTLQNQDSNKDGIDDGVGASYVDPDGIVDTPITVLKNNDANALDADYRSLDRAIVPPVATNDTTTAPVGTPVTINPLLNDTDDVGLDPTTVVLTNPPAGSTVSADGKSLTVPNQGIWGVNPTTGAITFTPFPGFTSDPTPISYTVQDTEGATSGAATVSIDYEATIIPPTAGDDTTTAPAGTPVTINPLLNDTDDGGLDPTTVVLTNPPAGSTVSSDGKSLTVPGQGTWTVNSTTGEITFTPVPGFTGNPTAVGYTVRDNTGAISNAATVRINYFTPGQLVAPTASDDVLTVTNVSQGSIDPLTNDVDVDGSLDPTTVVFVNVPQGSSLTPDGKTLTVPGEGTWDIDLSTGLITFTSEAGFQGNPTAVQYTVADNDGLISNPATIRTNFTLVAPEQIRSIRSLSDPDAILGDSSNDVLNGGSQKDEIRGAEGNDVINGGTNDDRLFGGKGNDLVNGGSGNDLIRGNSGNDNLNGGDGDDRIFGGRGRDVIIGSDGDDRLYGQQSRDTINGGAGDDLIIGGRGRDTMTGGQGQDTFRYRSTNEFRDVITDFELIKDVIDLRRIQTIGSMENLNFIQRGDDAIVKGWTGQRFKTIARLESVDVNDLNESNFRF
ncbi:MAG: DUF4347 domain-containing protein [Cyanobacteria bacterium P01_F01_bin.150]